MMLANWIFPPQSNSYCVGRMVHLHIPCFWTTPTEREGYEQLLSGTPCRTDDLCTPSECKSSKTVTATYITLVLCMVCTLVNVAVVFCGADSRQFASQSLFFPTPIMRQADIELLRRPSQFIGLDKTDTTPLTTPKHFTNYPVMMLPVDWSHPSKIFPLNREKYLYSVGTVLSEAREFQVTPSASDLPNHRFDIDTINLLDLNHSTVQASRLQNGELPTPCQISWKK